MHLQGFNIFGRGRIRRELDKKHRNADGFVLGAADEGYALIHIRHKTDAIEKRIETLRKFIEVRGLGDEALLLRMNVTPARPGDRV